MSFSARNIKYLLTDSDVENEFPGLVALPHGAQHQLPHVVRPKVLVLGLRHPHELVHHEVALDEGSEGLGAPLEVVAAAHDQEEEGQLHHLGGDLAVGGAGLGADAEGPERLLIVFLMFKMAPKLFIKYK